MLHEHGSSNPNGLSGNIDRMVMHPYFTFKDLVTFFIFFLVLSIIVCYFPNLLGQLWPNIMVLIVYIIYVCAISWKYILTLLLVTIYNKTILVSDLLIDNLTICLVYIIEFVSIYYFCYYKVNNSTLILVLNNIDQVYLYVNPNIVRYYYKVYNQQITKVKFVRILNYLILLYLKNKMTFFYDKLDGIRLAPNTLLSNKCHQNFSIISNNFLRVGISETICTQQKIINKLSSNVTPWYSSLIKFPSHSIKSKRSISTLSKVSSTLIKNEIVKDNHNNEISFKFKE